MDNKTPVDYQRSKLKAIRKLKKKQWKKRKQARRQTERKEAGGEGGLQDSAEQRKVVQTKDASTQVDLPDANKPAPRSYAPYPVRGLRMVEAALQRGERPLQKRKSESSSDIVVKKPKSQHEVKELDRSLLHRVAGVPALGSGTFGTCYLARYRNVDVAVKELHDKDGKKTASALKKAVLREARVLMELGDNKGLPHLFGVCSTDKPVCLVLLFHGEGQSCLTVYKATKASPALSDTDWKSIFRRTAEALQYIHDCDFIHNDLKSDNVVLEKCEDGSATAYNPVIIDFGCSVKTQDARQRTPKPNHLKEVNKGSYVAPEILDGTGKPSFCSDVYSFARMVELVHKRCNYPLFSTVRKALSRIPEKRPALTELKAQFF